MMKKDRRSLLNSVHYTPSNPFGLALDRAARAKYWKAIVALRKAEVELHQELGLPTGEVSAALRQAEQRYFYNRHRVASPIAA